MPTPNPDEMQEQFISRCIPMVIEEGTAADPTQANAICNSMWEKHMATKAEGTDLWVTVEQMKSLCPSCAEKMAANNLTRVNLRMLPDELKDGFSQGMCDAVGGDPGFFTSCMGMTFEGVTDQEAFCAELHKFCTGAYPAEQAANAGAAKAYDLSHSIRSSKVMIGAVKAVGDWTLDVLAVPYGGPNRGKDLEGQFFSPQTKLYQEQYPTPLVAYYHGFDEKGRPQGDPESIGHVIKTWTDGAGVWMRIALDKTKEFSRRVWEAARKGFARASSGSIAHLVRVAANGLITNWPLAEITLFDANETRIPMNAYAVAFPAAKAHFLKAGIVFPDSMDPNDGNVQPRDNAIGATSAAKSAKGGAVDTESSSGEFDMTPEELTALLDTRDAQKAASAAAEEDRRMKEQTRIDSAVTAAKANWDAEAAKGRRLPMGSGAPAYAKDADAWPFDGLDAGEQAVLVGVLKAAGKLVSGAALKALAIKLDEDKTEIGAVGRQAMKAVGMKANEIDYSTSAGFGDEWVGIAYSQSLWEAIRVGTFVVGKLPTIEVPQGMESIYLPLESTDPIWYKVAEATAIESTLKIPQATIGNSPLVTARVLLTLAKLGARVIWTGEMDEGSLVPFAPQLKAQLAASGAEYLESAIIDGDVTVSTANINDTAGGGPASTDWFTAFDGFRKSALVTTAANSRSAAGSLDVTDYIETVKLMGGAGINALDRTKVGFIVDPNTLYKTMSLPELLTKDVYSSPQIEGGRLVGLWGYDVNVSGSMHKNSSVRKANTAGEIDTDTTTNNAYGAIVAVRWDQWKFGWRRRMTIETTRIANADSTEIVAMIRCGLIQRDTEAASETYYVGV